MQEKELQSDPEPELNQFLPSTQSEGTNLVFLKTVDLTGKFYTDQTGRFPITSRKGKIIYGWPIIMIQTPFMRNF